ncbi:MAG: hypothetical protein V3S08_09380 [Phycisphaerales bacterium]
MKPDSIKRRVFIGRVARKAAYIAPAVLALKAAQTTYAGPSGCGQTGSPCNVDGDCCTGMGFTCKRPNSNPCTGQMNCTCEL